MMRDTRLHDFIITSIQIKDDRLTVSTRSGSTHHKGVLICTGVVAFEAFDWVQGTIIQAVTITPNCDAPLAWFMESKDGAMRLKSGVSYTRVALDATVGTTILCVCQTAAIEVDHPMSERPSNRKQGEQCQT